MAAADPEGGTMRAGLVKMRIYCRAEAANSLCPAPQRELQSGVTRWRNTKITLVVATPAGLVSNTDLFLLF